MKAPESLPVAAGSAVLFLRRRRASAWAAVALSICGFVMAAPASSRAALDVIPPGGPGGAAIATTTTQAGSHPDFSTTFNITPLGTPDDLFSRGGILREAVVDLSPGLIGNPEAVPKCSSAELEAGTFIVTSCPPASQVGTVQVRVSFEGIPLPTLMVPLYAVEPAPDRIADLAFKIGGTVTHIAASVRPSDYGLRLTSKNIMQLVPASGVTATVWGNPSDPSHDPQRCHILDADSARCDPDISGDFGQLFPSPGGKAVPFFTNAQSCDSPLEATMRVRSWYDPQDTPLSAPVTAELPPPTGCESLRFDPTISVDPDTTKPDAPSGLGVELKFPQTENVDGTATAQMRNATVTLPQGMTISPSSASGLKACSDAQLGFGTDSPVGCPPESKIGTVSADTPLLADPLAGSIYVGSQNSSDPESGEMFRLYMVLRGRGNLVVKLRGQIRADADTGQLTTTFANNPQFPLLSIRLRFKSGASAPLATPLACGQHTVEANLTSWSGQTAALTDSVQVDCPSPSGFAPELVAGMLNPRGGAFSPFTLRIERPDGQGYMDGLVLTMPPGLVARLRDVPLCADARAAAGTCPIETRVGSATVGAGPGARPFFLTGSVSLTGPYRGAPYGLSTSVRVLAGPFDLGTVVVRQAIYVDPTDAHITVASDPLPTIVGGVPIRLRSLNVSVDRPGFTLNPTSCSAKRITAALHSTGGALAQVSQRFQVGGCSSLKLTPRLRVRLTGRNQTSVGRHPGVKAVLTQPGGQANLKQVSVALPLTLALDPDNAQALCEFADGQKPEPTCPAGSVIGSAKAFTPLLDRPLTGKVYFVKNVRRSSSGRLIRTLPTLLIPLRGQVALNLRASTNVDRRSHLVSAFKTVPDAAVSRFELNLKGGRGGILVVTDGRNVCKGSQRATLRIDGHNGARIARGLTLATPCRSKR